MKELDMIAHEFGLAGLRCEVLGLLKFSEEKLQFEVLSYSGHDFCRIFFSCGLRAKKRR